MNMPKPKPRFFVEIAVASMILIALLLYRQQLGYAAPAGEAPMPLLKAGHPVY